MSSQFMMHGQKNIVISIYVYDNISLNSYETEKYFRQKL